MKIRILLALIAITLMPAFAAEKAPWTAGVATAVITPEQPMPMAGYGARKAPATGKDQDLFGKALAIEDQKGNRVVFITLDLIGVTAELRTAVEQGVHEKYKLPPHALVMNASHTHCGPAYGRPEVKDYFEGLVKKLIATVGRAIEASEPAHLSYAQAKCGFAMNRRTPTDEGYRNHPNPKGPVDHTVPVLRIDNAEGKLKAVMFGYACHNTSVGYLRWLGDYAGFAQQYFEADHPGVTAMFMMGCGGDQNPYPRGTAEWAAKHGRALCTAVEAALEVTQRTLRHQNQIQGPLKSVMETVSLEFRTKDREDFDYPVQVIQFGNDLSMITLGNEVVIDYVLRLKRELGRADGPEIWVSGYSNVYSGYIPSKRVLLEGGYEARSRPWKDALEERIIAKAHQLFGKVNKEK
ncbi:neutral/alkaline non-lysosomal ceramidase N-terminal domain-containing protein [Verrucomicrobia bacterium]|nr:neutral/alkaline non-lysosomal ceramidase N-terminal domain-containing protein [Verrucomicrobiota bacterium]MDC0218600.1 neutral/alkaline non-lysosomal ceramidase N-terminal domain-containing protein [Verrucomicrobiota bacterium]